MRIFLAFASIGSKYSPVNVHDLYCICVAPPVSPNYRMSITSGLSTESAYGRGIQSIQTDHQTAQLLCTGPTREGLSPTTEAHKVLQGPVTIGTADILLCLLPRKPPSAGADPLHGYNPPPEV